MEQGETERRGGREGSALCMACGVMSMVMKTKDGRGQDWGNAPAFSFIVVCFVF